MFQAAFDHEASFFDSGKRWQFNVNEFLKVLSFEILYFPKDVKNRFELALRYSTEFVYAAVKSEFRGPPVPLGPSVGWLAGSSPPPSVPVYLI